VLQNWISTHGRVLADAGGRASERSSLLVPGPCSPLLSQRYQRPRQPRVRTVKEQPHAQRFGPLYGHQLHLPADMIAIDQQCNLRLVVCGIPL